MGFVIGFGLIAGEDAVTDASLKPIIENAKLKPLAPLQYLPIKDTLYVGGDAFVLVSLKEQKARLFRCDGQYFEFPISSGNSKISKGIETSQGVFTVQSKSPLAISKQFDDAELYNWIGFNVNIGFHGLKGNGYYGHLGKRPSSHGCIRIGREDGEKMYKLVQRGTPVMVYYENPARTFAFIDLKKTVSDKTVIYVGENGRRLNTYMRDRLVNIYESNHYVNNIKKIVFDGKTILRASNFGVGNSDSIPYKQNLPVPSLHTYFNTLDNSHFNLKILEPHPFPKFNDKDTIEKSIKFAK